MGMKEKPMVMSLMWIVVIINMVLVTDSVNLQMNVDVCEVSAY